MGLSKFDIFQIALVCLALAASAATVPVLSKADASLTQQGLTQSSVSRASKF